MEVDPNEQALTERLAALENELGEMRGRAARADELGRQAAFYEQASGLGIRNLRLAYWAATQEGLFGENDEPDFGRLRASFPELFGGGTRGAAGAGLEVPGANPADMNDWIRKAAGRA